MRVGEWKKQYGKEIRNLYHSSTIWLFISCNTELKIRA